MTPDTFWHEFSKRADAVVDALRACNGPQLARHAKDLGDVLACVDKRLSIHLYGPDPFRVGILPLPGAEDAARAFVANHYAPAPWLVEFGFIDSDPVEAILVADEDGNSLKVSYAALTCRVLPPRDGRLTVVFSQTDDFDPSGPLGHLYRAVSDQLIVNLLGGRPAEIEKAVLLPAERVGTLEPLDTLRKQWLEMVAELAKP